jgi:hypothetical protein
VTCYCTITFIKPVLAKRVVLPFNIASSRSRVTLETRIVRYLGIWIRLGAKGGNLGEGQKWLTIALPYYNH